MTLGTTLIRYSLITLSLSVGHASFAAAAPSNLAEEASLTLRVTGQPRPIYTWAKERCSVDHIPDAPARAFRRQDGLVVLMAPHFENWMLRGPDFANLRPVCRPAYSSKSAGKPGEKIWIEGLYTHDGRTISALGSLDLTEVSKRQGCKPTSKPGTCWLNKLIELRSTDMGDQFEVGQPVASISDQYPQDTEGRFGIFTTSNVAKGQDGAYYMIAWAEGTPMQARGNCLFRSTDPLKSGGWRAWDGQEFSVAMNGADKVPCRIVPPRQLPNEVRSLSWSSTHGTWIAVFASRQKLAGDDQAIPGFYFATSRDLLNWSASRRIMPAPTKAREHQSLYMLAYPSLIDPESKSRNFDTIDGGRPYLFFTWHHLKNGNGTMNRDLYYVPLTIE